MSILIYKNLEPQKGYMHKLIGKKYPLVFRQVEKMGTDKIFFKIHMHQKYDT